MAAVIGSTDNFNRDPLKMPRWNAQVGATYCNVGGGFVDSNSTNFWVSHWSGLVTSAAQANTARTVYTVSGKGGWLINACGSSGNNHANTTTFVITVDGVATTVALAEAGDVNSRGWLGPVGYDYLKYNTHEGNVNNSFMRGTAASGGTTGNTTWDRTGNNMIGTHITMPGMLNSYAIDPMTVLRFDNSLTVTVATSGANSNSNAQNAGVLVRLDS